MRVENTVSQRVSRFLPKFIASLFISILGLFLHVSLATAAVTVEYEWVKTIGGTSSDLANRTVIDSHGNVFITGRFEDTVNFDPDGGGDVKTSNGGRDVFLSKYSSDGNYLWTKTFGGAGHDEGGGIAIDDHGNIYLAGTFSATVDFDPDGGGDVKTSNGFSDAFIVKYSNDGSYQWSKVFGGTSTTTSTKVGVDSNQNLIIQSGFTGTVDFDPDGDGDVRTSNGGVDISLTKFSEDGEYLWTRTFGDTLNDIAFNFVIDGQDNVFLAGYFQSTVDFDPNGDGDIRTSNGGQDAFITKFSGAGEYLWTRTFGGDENDDISGLDVDEVGNVYASGRFRSTVDFNPDGDGDVRTSNGDADMFLTKYTSSGSYLGTKMLGGVAHDYMLSIIVAEDRSIYASGVFDETMDFDPEGSGDIRISGADADTFVLKMRNDFSHEWVVVFGDGGNTVGHYITRGVAGELYIAGYFAGTVDFDPISGGDIYASNGGIDGFLLKLQTYAPGYSLDNYSTTINLVEGETLDYEASLTAPPESNVEVNLEIDQPKPEMGSGIEVSPASLIFTPSNWSTPQTITIEALSDNVITDERMATIRHAITTDDVDYNILGIADVHVFIDEFDISRPNRHAGLGDNEFKISSVNGEYYGGNRTIRTNDRKPTIRFNRSTDNRSGLDYYQIRLYRTDALGRKSGGEYVWIDNIPDEPATDEDRMRTRDGHEIKYRGNSIVIELTDSNKYRLDKGTYFMRVRAFDKAGNRRNTGEIRLIIDDRYTAEFKRMGRDPLSEDTTLTLTHIGSIPDAGRWERFYYTSNYVVFRGNIDQEQVGFDIEVMLDGVEVTRRETFLDGSFWIPVMVPRGTREVEIKVASLDTEQARKRLRLTVDPTRQSFPPHLR